MLCSSGLPIQGALPHVILAVSSNHRFPKLTSENSVVEQKYYLGLYGKSIHRYLGHENRNKNTSKLLTLSPCLVCALFSVYIFGRRFSAILASFRLRANGRNNSQQCWELLANKVASVCTGDKSMTGFKLCATTSNNMQQGVQADATCNIQQCWELLANNVASVCTNWNSQKC